MRTRLICLGAVACAVAMAQPAAAQVQPAGTGEPPYTNSAQNTQFFEWPAQPQGIDAYQVQYRYYANNAEVASPTVNYGTSARSTWANWSAWRRSSTVASTASARRAATPSPTTRSSTPTARARARWAR